MPSDAEADRKHRLELLEEVWHRTFGLIHRWFHPDPLMALQEGADELSEHSGEGADTT